jgi:hypothetical protein
LSLSFHSNRVIRETDRATTLGETTSLLLTSWRVAGTSRFTNATSLGSMDCHRCSPGDPDNDRFIGVKERATVGPNLSGLPKECCSFYENGKPVFDFQWIPIPNSLEKFEFGKLGVFKDKCGKCWGTLKTTLQYEIVSKTSTVAFQT